MIEVENTDVNIVRNLIPMRNHMPASAYGLKAISDWLLYRLLLRSVSTLCHNVPSFQFSKVLFYQFFVDFSHPLTTCSLGCYLLSRFPEIWSKLPCHTSIHAFEIYPEKQMRESCAACHTKKLTLFCKYLVEYNSQVRMFALMWILLSDILVHF